MTDVVRLELVDRQAVLDGDGANEGGVTRAGLFRRAALTGSALLGGGVLLTGVPQAYAQDITDTDILNLLLLNESLEVAFYSEAVDRGALTGRARTFARQVRENEEGHRNLVRDALGDAANDIPSFDFGNTTASQERFLATALALENNDVAVANGAGPLIRSKALLAVAGQIVSVEARQAAWIRRIVYGPTYASRRQYPAPEAFDDTLTPAQARRALVRTGFIEGGN